MGYGTKGPTMTLFFPLFSSLQLNYYLLPKFYVLSLDASSLLPLIISNTPSATELASPTVGSAPPAILFLLDKHCQHAIGESHHRQQQLFLPAKSKYRSRHLHLIYLPSFKAK